MKDAIVEVAINSNTVVVNEDTKKYLESQK
jgi:hypothetical protein